MTNPARQAAAVLHRDGWRCQCCGLDCREVEKAYHDAVSRAVSAHAQREKHLVMQVQHIASGLQLQGELRAIRQRLRDLGFRPGQSFYEVHHIIPVVEGGGGCGLEGLQTLCPPCHRRLTAELAARRARRPLKAWHPTLLDRQGRIAGAPRKIK